MKYTILIFFLLFAAQKNYAQRSKDTLSISPLTDNIYVFTSHSYFDGKPFPANGIFMITDSGAVMIDTPWDTTETIPLLRFIEQKHGKKVIACISTHSHEDRTGGLDILKKEGVKTYSSRKTKEICVKNNEKLPSFTFSQDTLFKYGGISLYAFYPGEGHTQDNIVIWFENQKVLYGGCLVKSTETSSLGFIKEANLDEWPNSIHKIQKRFKEIKYVVPGHQSWEDKTSLEHTLQLLKAHRKE